MLMYEKMSVFNAPKDTILAQACNSHGIWGAGIAVAFKSKFPLAYASYNSYCMDMLLQKPNKGAAGKCLVTFEESGHYVACLMTSFGYGQMKDHRDKIIAQTYLALDDFFNEYNRLGLNGTAIYSNKFNSGLFNVPWEETEKAIKYFVELHGVSWIVCDPN